MYDPFSEAAVGVKVPQMNPEATFSSYDYEVIQFKATASGNAVLLANFDANKVP